MRNFVFPLGARAFVNFAYMGGFFLFPILMERVYGYSETAAGLLSTARPLVFSLSAPMAGYAAVKVGERWSVVAGAAALCVSMVVFTQVGADPSMMRHRRGPGPVGTGQRGRPPRRRRRRRPTRWRPRARGDERRPAPDHPDRHRGRHPGHGHRPGVGHGGAGSLASFHRAYLVGALVALAAVVCGFFVRDTPRGTRGVPTEVSMH